MSDVGGARVQLGSWAEVEAAAEAGLVDERTFCELKAGLPPSNAKMNLEVQRDLASFGPLGGVLLYGVRDAGGGRAGDVVGVEDAEGAKTRLVALAQAIQPSVVCELTVLPGPDDSERGVVLVEVPPSATAPHMVDGRYWGRSSEGKRQLSDPEVADIFARRRLAVDDFLDRLQALADPSFDVSATATWNLAHLHFLSRPLHPLTAGSRPEWMTERAPLLSLITRAGIGVGTQYGGVDVRAATYNEGHPHGVMAASRDPRELSHRERDAMRLLVRDDGGVEAAVGGASDDMGPAHDHTLAVLDYRIGVIVEQLVHLVSAVGEKSGYAGTHRIGVRLSDINGLAAQSYYSSHGWMGGRPSTFPGPEYVQTVDVTRTDLDDRSAVVDSLLGGLRRALGLPESREGAKLM